MRKEKEFININYVGLQTYFKTSCMIFRALLSVKTYHKDGILFLFNPADYFLGLL